VLGLNFNTHGRAHFLRAVQEGIVFALNHGLRIMKASGIEVRKVRAGWGNMFLSPLFQEIFAAVTGAEVELFQTDGAAGAARGAGLGAGIFKSPEEAFRGLEAVKVIEPDPGLAAPYEEAFAHWSEALHAQLRR
jgi:xylulokinase